MLRASMMSCMRVGLLSILVGFGACSLPASASASSDLSASMHPGIGRGDFEFYVDATTLRRAADGKMVARLLVQLPVLALLQQANANEANLRVSVQAYDAAKVLQALASQAGPAAVTEEDSSVRSRALRRDQQIRVLLEELDGVEVLAKAEVQTTLRTVARENLKDTDYQLAELPLEMTAGDYALEILVENLSRSKKGLLDRLRKRPMNASARMLFRVQDLHQPLALADPVFMSGYVQHSPYASRIYGLLNDSLHVAVTLYGDGPCSANFVIRDRAGEVHWRDSLEVRVDGSRELSLHESVNTFPAGQYVLAVMAENANAAAATTRSFDVAWSLMSWKKSQRDLDLEAEIVLTEKEFETFSHLPLGEKERFMERFWGRQDPTPETAYNEVLEEFHRRVSYADVHFSESLRGALSDRGKVYIRFGPPTEVQAEALASHLAGEGSEDLIQKIEDPYSASEHSPIREGFDPVSGSVGAQRERQRQIDQHSLVVGRARELVSYELWLYVGAGDPLLPRDDSVGIDTGLRLLFVDNEGFGDYQLRKSSAQIDIHGLRTSF